MFDFGIEEPKRTEEPRDIDFKRAVEAAGVSSFWSEFHDEARPLRWGTVALAATVVAAVGIGIWIGHRRRSR